MTHPPLMDIFKGDSAELAKVVTTTYQNDLTVVPKPANTVSENTNGFDPSVFAKQLLNIMKTTFVSQPGGWKKDEVRGATSESKQVDPQVIDLIAISSISEDLACNPRFWNSLSALYCYESIARYRFPKGSENGSFSARNLVSNRVSSSYLGRQWLKLHLTKKGPRKFDIPMAKRPSVDFWESHVFKQSEISEAKIVRAFIQFQYPLKNGKHNARLYEGMGSKKHKTKDGHEIPLVEGLRLMIKHLVGHISNQHLNNLTDLELVGIMKSLNSHYKYKATSTKATKKTSKKKGRNKRKRR
jgi:hypothetical protein